MNANGGATITVLVQDDCGTLDGGINQRAMQFTINITAVPVPPVISLNGNQILTIECHTPFLDPGATAKDAAGATVPVSMSGELHVDAPGTYIITYSATDINGNTATVTRTVNVVDTTVPVVTLNGAATLTLECHTAFVDPGATAADTCAGPLAVAVSGIVDANTPGTYVLTYTAVDSAGNTATATRTVTVVDTTGPVVTLNGANPLTISVGQVFSDPGATALDTCAGVLPVTVLGAVNVNIPGSYVLTYFASDFRGNSTTRTRTVNVVDPTPNQNRCPVPIAHVSNSDPFFSDPNAKKFAVISADATGAFVQLSGATSTDADNDLLSFRWFVNALITAHTEDALPRLPNGNHAIVLEASDGRDCTTVDSSTVEVISLSALVHRLSARVDSAVSDPTVKSVLLQVLAEASVAFDEGRIQAGIGRLQMFQSRAANRLSGQTPLVEELTQFAQAIINSATALRAPRLATRPSRTTSEEPACNDCPADAAVNCCGVSLATGENVYQEIDLQISGVGMIWFEFVRTWLSQLNYVGPLGPGWTFNLHEFLIFEPNGDIIRFGPGGSFTRFRRQPNGSFLTPPGEFRSFLQSGSEFLLRDANGFLRTYRSDGRLISYTDPNGNSMLLRYNDRGNLVEVVDPYGRIIQFFFQTFPDGVDRLVRILDPFGREVIYSYNNQGQLISKRSPAVTGTSTGNDFPNGRTMRYEYADGKLSAVIFPEEGGQRIPALSWVYGQDPADSMTFGKVVAATRGGVNASGIPAGGTTAFSYSLLNQDAALGNRDLPRLKVTTTQPNGNKVERFFNEAMQNVITRQFPGRVRPGEPEFYETKSFFNKDHRLVRRVFPELNELIYLYDENAARAQQQNPVEIRRKAGPRGGGPDLVTRILYEPLLNRILSITDPRQNVSRLFYDYQESSSPIPEAARFGIDLSSVPRGLGDLNGDGRTDQIAGKLVRTEGPAVNLPADSREALRRGTTVQSIITQLLWNSRGQPISRIDAEGNVDDFLYNPENDPDGNGIPIANSPIALTGAPTGYLKATVRDSRTSSRRTTAAPPAALETTLRRDPVGNVIGIRNPRGVWTHIERNQLNEPVVITRAADVADAIAAGEIPSDVAALAYKVRMFYDRNGRVTRTETENRDSNTKGVGPWIRRAAQYDILNHLIASTAEVGNNEILTILFRYDANELLAETTRPGNDVTRIARDGRNLPFRITRGFGSPEAATTQTDYDGNGNPIRQIDAEDNDGDGAPEATTIAYDGFDRPVLVTDPLDNQRQISYDSASNPVRVQVFGHEPQNNGPVAARALAAQSAHNNGLLAEVLSHFDELNRLVQQDKSLFLPEGFNPVRPVQLHDQNGDGFVSTRLEYDALSRPTFAWEDDLQISETTYDGLGRATATRDPVGNRLLREYDKNSNAIRVHTVEVSPEAIVPEKVITGDYVYDQLDRLARATDQLGHTTRFTYDSRDNLIGRSDPEGEPMLDPLGIFPRAGQSGAINTPGNTTSWFHDGLSRVIEQVIDLRVGGTGAGALDRSNRNNRDGKISLGYRFDANSRVAAIIDDKQNETLFEYDALDRKIAHINADQSRFTYLYDRDGNVREVIDPNGTHVAKTYDVLNRLTAVDITRAAGTIGTTHEAFSYDGLSRVTAAFDDNGLPSGGQNTSYIYDSLGRLIEEVQNGQPISSAWSGDGKRLSINYPGGRIINHSFDTLDRIKTISDVSGMIAESHWMGPGYRELKRKNGNGTTLSFLNDLGNLDAGYDGANRLVRLRALLPDGITGFIDREYGYNRAGQRTFERRNDDSGLTDIFTYDSAYRIVRSDFDQNGLPSALPRDLARLNYTLDGVGNRVRVDTATRTSGTLTDTYAVNEVNEYTAISGVTQVHDQNGNLTDDGSRLFKYDYKNRLVQVIDKATGNFIAQYLYHSNNRRSRKLIFSQIIHNTVAADTTYLYDGWRVVEEQQGVAGATETTYTYSPVYIDEIVQFERTAAHPLGPGKFYTHQNARADVIAITDASGNVVEKTDYDDFGNPSQLSTVGNPFYFQGQRLDPETGLYYFRNRYYNPETGRFIQRDPVWDAGNVGNQYTFAAASPISAGDPSGLQVPATGPTPMPTPTPTTGSGPSMRAAPDDMKEVQSRGDWWGHLWNKWGPEGWAFEPGQEIDQWFFGGYLGESLNATDAQSEDIALIKAAGVGTLSAATVLPVAGVAGSGIKVVWNGGFSRLGKLLMRRFFYELGQKTLPDAMFTSFLRLQGSGMMTTAGIITRGRILWHAQGFRSLISSGSGWFLGISKTFSTGPTPGGWLGLALSTRGILEAINQFDLFGALTDLCADSPPVLRSTGPASVKCFDCHPDVAPPSLFQDERPTLPLTGTSPTQQPSSPDKDAIVRYLQQK